MGALLPDIKFQVLFRRVSEHCKMAKVTLYTWQVALTCLQVILKCITTETIGTLAAAEGQLPLNCTNYPSARLAWGLRGLVLVDLSAGWGESSSKRDGGG